MFVRNGNATPEALRYLRPWLVAYRLHPGGVCPHCGYRLAGAWWESRPEPAGDGTVHALRLER